MRKLKVEIDQCDNNRPKVIDFKNEQTIALPRRFCNQLILKKTQISQLIMVTTHWRT